MDVTEKVNLVLRPPTEEVVTQEELLELFKTNSKPKHYIGIEISGFLHLGSLISTGFKINDFVKAGVDCTVFLADWHTLLNEKLGGSFETIRKVSKYYDDAFRLVCPKANIVLGTDLYDSKKEYWSELVQIAKHMSLARTMRTLTIIGRSENDEKVDLAKLIYPAMQATDIHSLDLDIVHAGMDQRKIHMLVKDVFPKMKWKVPVAVHHKLLPGLA
jgi:tyrosyl-tRNA synthetase